MEVEKILKIKQEMLIRDLNPKRCRLFGQLKFMYSKKAKKIVEIFTVDLTLFSKRQIEGEDFVNFCGILRQRELY